MSGNDHPSQQVGSWEFWPAWAVYPTLLPWWLLFTIRYGGPTVFTACNPAIEHSGFVGESKSAILRLLPPAHIAPFVLIDAGDMDARVRALAAAGEQLGYPFILKPDVGERGTGVRLIRDVHAGTLCLQDRHETLVAQRYHPGPFEAGIFYVRHPSEPRGRIFSLTLKQFPSVVGDGERTVSQLIEAHPRLRRQLPVFLARLGAGASRILARGERLQLAIAGNHCQGTMFLDGRWVVTPALERAIDAIAQATKGFHFGRFDVRYSDEAAFSRGEGFEIIELNGVLSEATHIYDPAVSYWEGQRVLREQWRLAYSIGRENRLRGCRVSSLAAIWRSVKAHTARPSRLARAD